MAAALKFASPAKWMNLLAAEIALTLECHQIEEVVAAHIMGRDNVVADALSRLTRGASFPPELLKTRRRVAPPRTDDFYMIL